MTPEEKENALRAQARRCAEEITKAMSVKPKPKWNAVCPPHPSQALREGKADGCQPGEICKCYWAAERPLWSGIMKERGMIFNGEMTRAILDGRKTQTRRIMKVQPSEDFTPMNMALETDYKARWYTPGVVDKDGYLQPASKEVFGVSNENEGYSCPFGAVGDRIWVRETWAILGNEDGCCIDWEEKLCKADERSAARIYRASCEQKPGNYGLWSIPDDADWKPHTKDHQYEGAWRPSIHMPRWASRILLEITDVRVERLNSISQEDAQAEGMELTGWRPTYSDPDSGGEVMTPYDNFAELWSSICGDESWKANPWVWVISFKRVEGGAA